MTPRKIEAVTSVTMNVNRVSGLVTRPKIEWAPLGGQRSVGPGLRSSNFAPDLVKAAIEGRLPRRFNRNRLAVSFQEVVHSV
jgi:hypothetical protein